MQKSLVYSPEYVIGEDGFCTFLQKLRKLNKVEIMFVVFWYITQLDQNLPIRL